VSNTQPPGHVERSLDHLPVLLVVLVAAYVPFLGGGFLTDDFAHLERLSYVPDVSSLLASPDVFGFYRPLTQASLALDMRLFGPTASRYRAANLVLHASVLGAAFLVARLMLGRGLAASLATLAYALTPKAHPIAVLWVSARAELLTSLFTLLAVAAWLLWDRRARTGWLALLVMAYTAAVLSKETAVLLPLVLVAFPARSGTWRSRMAVASLLGAVAAILLLWRAQVGARMPTTGDALYVPSMPVERLLHNLRNYAGRMVPAPIALVLLIGIATHSLVPRVTAAPVLRSTAVRATARIVGEQLGLIVFALVWSVAFLLPALPFVARSELYLYLPAFGVCVLAGSLADGLVRASGRARAALVATGIYAIGLGLYQTARSVELHRDLVFSAAFVAALERSPEIAVAEGPLALVPADPATERFLRDAIGGYFPVVLRRIVGGRPVTAAIEYDGQRIEDAALRLVCTYANGEVKLSR
jgi:hypothetical protein